MNAILVALQAAAALIAGLKSSGVNLGPIGDVVAKDIAEYTASKANYENGQAVVVGTFSENNVQGYIVAVKQGGQAAGTLGL